MWLFQLAQAPGYIEEHITEEIDYEIWVYQHSEDQIREQIQSRYRSQTKYNVWIQYDINDKSDPVKRLLLCVFSWEKNHWHVCTHSQYPVFPWIYCLPDHSRATATSKEIQVLYSIKV